MWGSQPPSSEGDNQSHLIYFLSGGFLAVGFLGEGQAVDNTVSGCRRGCRYPGMSLCGSVFSVFLWDSLPRGAFYWDLVVMSFLLCRTLSSLQSVFSARHLTTRHALEDSDDPLPSHGVIWDLLAIFKIYSSKLLELGYLSKQFL